MKRRDFLTKTIISGSTLGLGISCGRKINSTEENTINQELNSPSILGTITEPAREIPIFASTDVLVIGGGPSGTAAAIAASRTGAETYLVERYNHLGGLWTGGLVLPLLSTHAIDKNNTKRHVLHGIGGEMAQRLKDLGMSIYDRDPVVDPEAAKYVLDAMIVDAGVKMLFYSWASNVIMDGNNIKGVLIESKSGRMAILAKVVIDCTGDGDVFHWAGDDYDMIKYHIGLVHRLGNIDRIDTKKPGYKQMYIGDPTPIKSVNWVNMFGKTDQNGIDLQTLSDLQLEYRKTIWDSIEELKNTPGYEDVFLLDTASQIGVRMTRILNGKYKLTLNDTMTFKSFNDVIGISGAWTSMTHGGSSYNSDKRPMWQIPYRSLLPKKTNNLLVAGRCFSFEDSLAEDTRVIGTCLITGHGAGAAAGLAIKEKIGVKDIDVEKLKSLLLKQGAFLG